MQVKTEHLLGALGAMLDPNGPTVTVVQLSKAELAILGKAADVLEKLRTTWTEDEDDAHTDVALAMYTMRELIEENGRLELARHWASHS